MNWYEVENIDSIDSPALVLHKERMLYNIDLAIQMIGNVDRLRPHVKTNKIAEVCRLMMDKGITKFKCATIAEAEMLGMINAPDVLLAYQPVGPKIKRWLQLAQQYPSTKFSCLVDDASVAKDINTIFESAGLIADVFIDIDAGMHRTGIAPGKVIDLSKLISENKYLHLQGLHVYDGNIIDTDEEQRKIKADEVFAIATKLQAAIETASLIKTIIVIGGSPTFPIHAKREAAECSPGTFVFWDAGYSKLFPDEAFKVAAVLVTRVISIPNETMLTTDLGHKSVAAESPQPRVQFLNADELTITGQSEEHLVLKTTIAHSYKPGDVLYAIPNHICPTIALYDKVYVAENNVITGQWKVIARDRSINY